MHSKTTQFKAHSKSNQSSKILSNLLEMTWSSTVSEKAVGFSPLLVWLSFPYSWQRAFWKSSQPVWGIRMLAAALKTAKAESYYFLVTSINFFLTVAISLYSPRVVHPYIFVYVSKIRYMIYTTVCPTRLWTFQGQRTCPFLMYIQLDKQSLFKCLNLSSPLSSLSI